MNKKPVHPPSREGQILIFLAGLKGRWATWGTSYYMPSVQQVFPAGTSEGFQLVFMKRLQGKGLVGGCPCGCRGDYVLTSEGAEFMKEESLGGESAYIEFYRTDP